MVMVRDIPLHSLCEHHLVPFVGQAHVAYIPGDDGRITGLSKLARLVDGFAQRPQVQERLTTQIADALVDVLSPSGVLVRHRGRAPLHVDAGREQARVAHRHLGGARAVPEQRGHPGRGDEPHQLSRKPPVRREARNSASRAPGGIPVSCLAMFAWSSVCGSRPAVMGVVNVTPDSFSDGGRFLDPGAAVAHGLDLVAAGADVLDVGGESTRPGADAVPRGRGARAGPARRRPRWPDRAGVPVSVDTRKAAVAAAALDAGATIVNDVSAGRDAEMLGVVGGGGRGLVAHAHAGRAAHDAGRPRATTTSSPRCGDFLVEPRRGARGGRGRSRGRCGSTPGIGFGKTAAHNLALLAHLDRAGRARRRPGPRRDVAQVVPRRAVLGDGAHRRATTARSPPSCGPSTAARGSSGSTTSGAAADAVRLLDVMHALDAEAVA